LAELFRYPEELAAFYGITDESGEDENEGQPD
jgi:hypothetical protein